MLLRTPWELLDDFERRHGWLPGTLQRRGPVDPSTDQSEAGLHEPGLPAYRQAAEAMRLERQRSSSSTTIRPTSTGAVAAGLKALHPDVTDPAGSFGRVRRRVSL